MRSWFALALVFLAGCGRKEPELRDLARKALSQIDGEIFLDGLSSEVEVLRDRWGIPHIYAKSDSDFDVPSVERDGGAGTVNATGAVYRLVTDFSDLDRSLAIIAPGQSGQPASPYYDNFLEMWVKGEMFELPYTREAVEKATAHRLVLEPR